MSNAVAKQSYYKQRKLIDPTYGVTRYKDPAYRDKYYVANRESIRAKARARHEKVRGTPEYSELIRRKALRINYGLTEDQYTMMLQEQSSSCAICKAPYVEQKMKRLHVDHNHVSGKVRGLLCSSCNLGLGKFSDSAEMLRAAAEYLDCAGGVK